MVRHGGQADLSAPTTPTASAASAGPTRFAPLDGIRALAVTAVILFHAAPSWATGGYFGVDLFFILSGYLITSLLLGEWQRTGAIGLKAFWGRRARRLLPALFLMLAVVAGVAFVYPKVLGSPDLFGDTAATLGYVANWHFIAVHTDYFAAVSNPSPLQHTWTLAIEEQFYVVWPLVVLAIFWVVGRLRSLGPTLSSGRAGRAGRAGRVSRARPEFGAVAVVAAVGAVASAILMAALTPIGAASVSRAYYGSDTRAQGLLVGCGLAALSLWWGPVRTAAGRRALWFLGWAGAVGVLVMCLTVAETSTFAFHGGFLVIALCGAAVIASVRLLPGHPVATILSTRPLPYLGRISYGMYLWYWPVLLVMTSARTNLHGVDLLAARLLVIVAASSVSYHLVEMPIQRGALARMRAWVALPTAAAAAAILLLPLVAPLDAAVVPSPAASASFLSTVSGPGATGTGATSHPVRILLIGDSVAGSLGVGLSEIAPLYGAQVVNHGTPGCSLASADQVKVLIYTDPPGSPCRPGDPAYLLDAYRSLVNQYDPDVVLYAARSDTLTTYLDGSWQHLGMPAFDRWAVSRFEQAIPVLSSRGARVVFLTSPLYDSGEQMDGTPWPENNPGRVSTDNRLITKAADRYPDVASVIDFGQMLSPGGHFASAVDGVPMRCTDGVHLTVPGGEWVGKRILPRVVSLGRTHASAAAGQARPVLPPQPIPVWYPKLPCGS
jgi:peptidoglycan/LPS O-acetylase OafA/YrhL